MRPTREQGEAVAVGEAGRRGFEGGRLGLSLGLGLTSPRSGKMRVGSLRSVCGRRKEGWVGRVSSGGERRGMRALQRCRRAGRRAGVAAGSGRPCLTP